MPDALTAFARQSSLRVGLHAYRTDPLLSQRDGVNMAHENITQLLRQLDDPNIAVHFHDFPELLANEDYARVVLTPLDCVVSNAGPHAHYYFHLRERLGLDFRIIRDVRTAIWSSYLLQEHLCQPFLRAGDTLMLASRYTLALYHRLFPVLRQFPATLCYPLTVCFPAVRPYPRPTIGTDTQRDIVLGFLGRLSEDKNFPDLVELLIRLNRDQGPDRRYRLLACGDIHSNSCHPNAVHTRLAAELGEGNWFEHIPALDNGAIWNLLPRFDMMLFPSTSNLETFGRVLIEASFMHIPIVSADHAAAPELIDPSGLCPVDYRTDIGFPTHLDHQLGRVPVERLAEAIIGGNLRPSNCYDRYAKHESRFVELLRRPPTADEALFPLPSQQEFIDRLCVELPPTPSSAQASALLDTMAAWFLRLTNKALPGWDSAADDLLSRSAFPERTRGFIDKARRTSGDFTNVGGVDIELCHIAGFYPHFTIAPQAHTP